DIVPKLDKDKKYVLKVDQGVKGRMKKGLVKLNLSQNEVLSALKELSDKGYSNFILEEMFEIAENEEKYLSIERIREGILILYAEEGGIEIEKNKNVHRLIVTDEKDAGLKKINLPQEDLKKIIHIFNKYQ